MWISFEIFNLLDINNTISYMWIKTVNNEEVTAEELGGAIAHSTKSGVTHITSANDIQCLAAIKKLLSYLPQNNRETTKNYLMNLVMN